MSHHIPAEMLELRPGLFRVRVVVCVTTLVLGGCAVLAASGPVAVLAQLIVGAAIAYGVELTHQCLHGTATGRRREELVYGRILSLLAFRSYTSYRYTHLRHHRLLGTLDDPEPEGYAWLYSEQRWRRVLGVSSHFSQVLRYTTAIRRGVWAARGKLQDAWDEASRPPADVVSSMADEYRLLMCGLAAVVVTTAMGSDVLLKIWIVPVLAGYGPIHGAIILPEHFWCLHDDLSLHSNTRSIRAGWLGRWFTNFNSHHAGHHKHAGVPLEKLPKFENLLRERGELGPPQTRSYTAFYRDFASYVWTGQRPSMPDRPTTT
jgi:fatty acid desaturase